MVPIIEQDSILLLGYSILYKENSLTRVNHPKKTSQLAQVAGCEGDAGAARGCLDAGIALQHSPPHPPLTPRA